MLFPPPERDLESGTIEAAGTPGSADPKEYVETPASVFGPAGVSPRVDGKVGFRST